jgi:GT2 family glycosyltransferase
MREPLVDIVVLVHDKADWAELCIKSVERFTKNPYRLTLVDMASVEPKTKALFIDAEAAGHRVIRLAENRSFSHGVNVGVNAGTAKFVIVLNDDAIVTEGWDTALISDASPKYVGLVGARSNYAAGAQGGAKCVGDPPYLVFVCVCMRRDVWEKVGPMDEETFDGFSSEDLDYSWRVVKHGLKLKLSSAFVLHAGSRTLMSTTTSLGANNEKYNLRLIEKWGKEWVTSHTKLMQQILVATYSPQETVNLSFAASCIQLKQAGGYEFSFYNHRRTPIHLARQLVCDFALRQNFDVLVQLDDDATFPPDLLPRLLRHEKDVVCALAYQRKPPYMHVVYDLDEEKLKAGKVSGNHVEGALEHTGLRRFDVSGFHVSALRTSVLRKMKEAGIAEYWGGFDKCGEDFAFAANLKKVGIPLYVDTDTIAGHIAEAPVIDEGYRRAFLAGQAR